MFTRVMRCVKHITALINKMVVIICCTHCDCMLLVRKKVLCSCRSAGVKSLKNTDSRMGKTLLLPLQTDGCLFDSLLRWLRAKEGVLGKFPRSQHPVLPHHAPRLKVPTHSDLAKSGNFRKANWKCFCLLTDESVEILAPPDTTHIERAC